MAAEIENFIGESRAKGMSDDAIKSALLNMGVNQAEINAAFFLVPQQAQPQAVAPQTANEPVTQAVGSPGAALSQPNGTPAVSIPRGTHAVQFEDINFAAPVSKTPGVGKKTGLILGTAAMAIVAIGAGAYMFLNAGEQGKNELVPQETVSTSSLPAKDFVPVATGLGSATATTKDCGSTRDEAASFILLGFPPDIVVTAQEKDAISCMDAAIKDCAPATLAITSEGNIVEGEILGKENSNCLVSEKISYKGPEIYTCKIPASFISSLFQDPKAKSSGVYLNIAAAVSMLGAEKLTPGFKTSVKDLQGNPVQIDFDCVLSGK
ncbi:MAG: hypothetical protein Q7S36_02360 [Candidatus Liptonbacteria bacterium]|nr:hypothetical protein [Candidatus Liptonbacteria bacterium]